MDYNVTTFFHPDWKIGQANDWFDSFGETRREVPSKRQASGSTSQTEEESQRVRMKDAHAFRQYLLDPAFILDTDVVGFKLKRVEK